MVQRGGLVRLLEIVPGLIVWLTFIVGIALSIIKPIWVITFIMIFDLYWLFRVVYFIIFLLIAWRRYRASLNIDWHARVQKKKDWRDIYHLVLLPMVHEPYEVVDATFQALCAARYPSDRFIVVLCGEERAGAHFPTIAKAIHDKYSSSFRIFRTIIHPDGIEGEMKSKGANLNYAGHQCRDLIDELAIPYENVLVSAFDIDTIVHPDYFACLTATYLDHPDRTHASYQPVVLYNNTMWDSPAPMRMAAFSTTFWLMTELARPDRLFTFSSHSMPFKALCDVGFWDPTIVSEDSRIFLQCFIHYQGRYEVVPLYIPVSMDTVRAGNVWQSLINLYKQQRRWAWGVEHFPYLVRHFMHTSAIPLGKKLKLLWNQTEGMYTWATAPIIILLLGRLPLFFVGGGNAVSSVAQNAPFILEVLLNLSLFGILVIGSLSWTLLPPRPSTTPSHRVLTMFLQWLLLPISIIFLSSIPAIDAQTRMMFGRNLGFYVTPKSRATQ